MADIGEPRVRGPEKPLKKGELALIKTLIKHPMESGLRKDKETGNVIPAHFIEEVSAEFGGVSVMKATWSGAISKNPFFSFYVKADKSGPLTVTWKDNKGEKWTEKAEIKVE
ncbi:MAG: thiosulfate oxidation carrier complex protein SoxZ [Magnetococcales bacterium]|nr:thiosulfate oxidation carrier complex protein SoxZ [Magnetococcales bacterium]MBF0439666.1 thiosulfate oxidation carrier complex protein SoxZ [Magnetococcales bacterium]